MTALEKMRTFIRGYPGAADFAEFRIDYTDQIPANAGLFPSGLVEVSRATDILGNTTVTNQYNFALYCVFPKPPGDDAAAGVNADWVMDFQQWVQERSVTGEAPVFGDVPRQERVMAQNGALYETDKEGLALYMVQISAKFIKRYKEENPWVM